jgi:hypothetical protein
MLANHQADKRKLAGLSKTFVLLNGKFVQLIRVHLDIVDMESGFQKRILSGTDRVFFESGA